ncbi:hypothetical protein DC094_20250 [Pelagibaculum spongiae]|uniref:CHAD domain-containing protein n=2 Tax=Pelagibaculum spongiae TaxID=2080658 RepID=A0A2V1GNX2_9GAMM|nr:hypothetical protein DC094_20250 [Pelagibaculum spongiae]
MWITLISLLLLGCGDSIEDQIARQADTTRQAVVQLKQQLDGNKLTNAMLLRQYTQKVAEIRPDLKMLMEQLAKDATSKGPMFLRLSKRANTAYNQPLSFVDNNERLVELLDVASAADPLVFNDALSDPINVVADFSNGQLSRVNSIEKKASETANAAKDFGPGSQLMGNPTYGQWQTNSSGTSFWQWYIAYRVFDSLIDSRRRPSYGQWSRYRDYSYYGDYGWERYSSNRDKKNSYKVEQQTRKKFERQGKTFTSAYSKNRTGSSSLSKNSSWSKSSDRFKSSYAAKQYSANRSSNRFSSSSSQRNSSTRTSRSISGGK